MQAYGSGVAPDIGPKSNASSLVEPPDLRRIVLATASDWLSLEKWLRGTGRQARRLESRIRELSAPTQEAHSCASI